LVPATISPALNGLLDETLELSKNTEAFIVGLLLAVSLFPIRHEVMQDVRRIDCKPK
jgi:hypothetical protein